MKPCSASLCRSVSSAVRLCSLLILLASMSPTARAEIIEIAWNGEARFALDHAVPAGKFLEVCGKLNKGQTVAWSFDSQQSMDFNIHYHAGKQVVFPTQRDSVATLQGQLVVAVDQDYCWMWANKSKTQAPLSLRLQR